MGTRYHGVLLVILEPIVPEFLVATFYQFTRLDDPCELQEAFLRVCEEHDVRGTILLAHEGINATIAGPPVGVMAVLSYIKSQPRFSALTWQESIAPEQPFGRMRVRLKKEIVTLGDPAVDPTCATGIYVEPEDWNDLISDPDVIVVDTRNDYEVAIGTFRNAINPKLEAFGELTAWADENLEEDSDVRVAMFCTGGIRCEKSTALLKERGFDNVYHLRGGILNYLKTVPEAESLWEGACFVFDERIAVGHGLVVVDHRLCDRCQYPIRAKQEKCGHCQ